METAPDSTKLWTTVGSITSGELASKAGLNERYVREWLRAMVAAEYIRLQPKVSEILYVIRTGVRAVERGQPDVRWRRVTFYGTVALECAEDHGCV